jgi:hypothetical protein
LVSPQYFILELFEIVRSVPFAAIRRIPCPFRVLELITGFGRALLFGPILTMQEGFGLPLFIWVCPLVMASWMFLCFSTCFRLAGILFLVAQIFCNLARRPGSVRAIFDGLLARRLPHIALRP